MWVYILTYFIIGVIVALINNHLYTKLQTVEDRMNENPGMIIAMIIWVLFWPFFALILVVNLNMVREIIKQKSKNNGNR